MLARLSVSALVLTVAALVLAACSDARVATAEPTPTEEVVGSAWIVTSVNGQGIIPAAPPTLAFGADGKVSGSGGCNQYSAPYETTGGSIAIGDISSTLMLCEGAPGAQEGAFLAALRWATAWRVDDDGALHLDGAGEIIADPATQAPTPETSPAGSADGLVGAWDLAELGRTADFAHLQPTIEFSADGTVSGFAGCNTFSGSYTIDGATLSFGPMATTKMACQRPASAVESDYLAALSGVTGWAVEPDGRLRLDGAVPLRYARH
jgi:heat shock protein HslJ